MGMNVTQVSDERHHHYWKPWVNAVSPANIARMTSFYITFHVFHLDDAHNKYIQLSVGKVKSDIKMFRSSHDCGTDGIHPLLPSEGGAYKISG